MGDEFFGGFDGFGLFFGVLLPRWLLEAPKAPKSRKNYKKHEENATLFSGFWASTVAWQAKFTATVTAMMGLFWSANPP